MAQGDPPFNPISNALAPTPVPGTVSQTLDNPMDFIKKALAEDQPNDNGLAYLSADQLNELKESGYDYFDELGKKTEHKKRGFLPNIKYGTIELGRGIQYGIGDMVHSISDEKTKEDIFKYAKQGNIPLDSSNPEDYDKVIEIANKELQRLNKLDQEFQNEIIKGAKFGTGGAKIPFVAPNKDKVFELANFLKAAETARDMLKEQGQFYLQKEVNKSASESNEWGERQMDKAGEVLSNLPQAEGFIGQVGRMIPQVIGSAAGAAASIYNPAIGSALMNMNMAMLTTSQYGSTLYQIDSYAKEKGVEIDTDTRYKVALATSLIELATEKVRMPGITAPMEKQLKKLSGKLFVKEAIANPKAADEVINAFVGKNATLRSRILAGAKEFATLSHQQGKEEAIEEGIASIGQDLISYAYLNPEDSPGFTDMLKNAGKSALMAYTMGPIFGLINMFGKRKAVQDSRQKRGMISIVQTDDGKIYEQLGQTGDEISVIDEKGNITTLSEDQVNSVSNYGLKAFNEMKEVVKSGRKVSAEMQAEAELSVERDRIKATVQQRRYTGADQFEFIVNGQKQTGAPAIVTAQKADGSKWQILSGSVNEPNPGQPMIGINLETGERAMLSHKDVSNIDINSSEQMETDLMQEAQMRMNNKLNAKAGIEKAAEFNPGDAVTFNGLQGEIINAADPTQGVQIKVTDQAGEEQYINVTPEQIGQIQPNSGNSEIPNSQSNSPEIPDSSPATPEQINSAQPQKTMTVGKKQLAYEQQEDGSFYIPFADGKDETKAISAEVDDTQFDVVPVIEEVPIAGAPAFAKKKSNTVVKGVKIVPKAVNKPTNEQDLQGQQPTPNVEGLSNVQTDEGNEENTQAAEDRREEPAQYTEAQGGQPIIQTEASQTPASQDTEKSDNTVAGAISPKQEKNPYEGMSKSELEKAREKIVAGKKKATKKPSKEIQAVAQNTYSEPYQIVLQYFATGGKINPSALFELYGKAGKENDPDVKRKVESERRPRFTWVSKHDGLSIKTIADKLWEQNTHLNFDSMDYREAVEEVINSFTSPQQMAKKLLSIVGDETATIDEHTKLEQEYYATRSEGMDDDSPEYDEQLDNELDQEENIDYAMNLEALVDDGRILYLLSGDKNAINENGEIDWNVVSLKLANDPGYYTGDFLFDFNEQELNRIKELANENTANQRAEAESGEVNSEPDSSGETSITPASEQGLSEEAQGQPEEVTVEVQPELTASQKAVSAEIDGKVNDLKAQLAEIKANRSKKLAELQNRNSLFGDTQDTGNSLFENDDTFDTSKEAINKAIQPFTNQIADLERQIEQLSSSKTNAVKQAGNQTEITEQPRPQFAGQLLDKIITNATIAQEEAKVDTNPSEAQIEAGNYKKGHIKVNGFDISIENPKGSTRSGTDANGKAWSIEMQNSYGYFKGTKGYDGDQINVFLGDNPLSDKVFVVDQVNQDTGEFDESKILIGFSDAEQAKAAYLSNYSKDWKGFKAITETTVDDFKTWLYDGAKQRKPYNEYKDTPEAILTETAKTEDVKPISDNILIVRPKFAGEYFEQKIKEENKKVEAKANTIVTEDRYEELRKRMKAKLNNLNVSFDPETMSIGVEMAMFHIERGTRKFAAFVQNMVNDLGEDIKPYLKAFYKGAKMMPGMEIYSKEMDSDEFVNEYKYTNQDAEQTTEPATAEITESQVEAIEREAETVQDAESAARLDERIDVVLAKLDLQLNQSGYSIEGIYADYPSDIVSKGIKKDVVKYSKELAKALQWEHDTDHKGKKVVYANTNIAPAGGDATFILWMPGKKLGVYVSIPYQPEYSSGGGYDNYKIEQRYGWEKNNVILWRLTTPEKKYSGMANRYAPADVNVGDFAGMIREAVKYHLKNLTFNEKSINLANTNYEQDGQGTQTTAEPIGRNQVDMDEGQPTELTDGPLPTEQVTETSTDRGRGSESGISEAAPAGNGTTGSSGTQVEYVSPGRTNGFEQGVNADTGHNVPVDSRGHDEVTPKYNNHIIKPDDVIVPRGEQARIKANIAAVKIAKRLEKSGKQATDNEKIALAKYVGWGGLASVFDLKYYNKVWEDKYKDAYDDLKELLTPEEWRAAKDSTVSAYYTDRNIITNLWNIADRLGFKGGTVLDPAGGIGHFFGLMPEKFHNSTRQIGYELDQISGLIYSKLYPDANINVTGYENANMPNNSIDLAITNVPFGQIAVYDKNNKDITNFKIHNYFIAKSIRKLKPGGIGIFITSSATLDNEGEGKEFRVWVNSTEGGNADLVDAIRLPNNAFKENAGTEVTTDILVFRKRLGDTPSIHAKQFLNGISIADTKTKENKPVQIRVNEFFANNPDRILGKMMLAYQAGSGGLYTGDSQTCAPIKGTDLNQSISEAITSMPENILDADEQQVEYADEATQKEGSIHNIGGKVKIVKGGQLVDTEWNDNKVMGKYTKAQVVDDYNKLKDAVKEIINLETNQQSTDTDIEAARKNLNKIYDAFVKKYGNINGNKKVNFLKEDVESSIVYMLETVKETDVLDNKGLPKGIKLTIGKSDIFTKRVNVPRTEPTTADNEVDALNISLAYRNRIDTNYIASLLNSDAENVRDDLISQGLAFVNPMNGVLEDKDTYLSGYIREKLKQAKQAAELDEAFKSNVEALESALPEDIPYYSINLQLGAPWIPAEVIQEWISKTIEVNVSLKYNKTLNKWSKADGRDRGYYGAKNRNEFAGGGVDAIDLIMDALNTVSTVVYDRWKEDGKTKQQKNQKKTEEAQAAQNNLKMSFKNFAAELSEKNRENLQRIYNEKFNSFVLKNRSKPAFKHFPGASTAITLNDHQAIAAVRCISEPTLLAHQVGTGKTFTLITAAMEMRRLQTAKKPMIVVQKATLKQFEESFRLLYPWAKLLVPTDEELSAKERQNFFAKVALNDWDAIIVYHDALTRIPDDPNRQITYINERIAELEEAISDADDRDPAAKELEREITKLQEKVTDLQKKTTVKNEAKQSLNTKSRLTKQADRATDNILYFEQLGVDALLVDEAHTYKRLGFATKAKNIKGIDTSGSQKSFSVVLKTRHILENNNGKNVVFATGTPISNTMAEIWTMMKYLIPNRLSEYGVFNFDEFKSSFGEVVPSVEFTAAGEFKNIDRFSKYINLPELKKLFRSCSDVVLTKDNVKLSAELPKLAGGEFENIQLDMTPALEEKMSEFRSVLKAWEKLQGKEKRAKRHIPLVIFGLAKRAAIDVRLVDSSIKEDPGSKLTAVTKNVLDLYKQSSSYKGTQLVFADAYKSRDGRFNVYHEIKAQLIKAGVPESEIEIIHDHESDNKREKLFNRVNDGEVRVLLGSTEKLGIGVNVQRLLFAVHHIDAPQRPMDFEQRNGRILRQKNLHKSMDKDVHVLLYGVKKTLDATAYQRLAIKHGFIVQALNDDMTERTLTEDTDDIAGMSYSQMMATLSGSQYAIIHQKKIYELKSLQVEKNIFTNRKKSAYDTIKRNKGYIANLELFNTNRTQALKYIDNSGINEGVKKVQIGSKIFEDTKDIKLHTQLQDYFTSIVGVQRSSRSYDSPKTVKIIINDVLPVIVDIATAYDGTVKIYYAIEGNSADASMSHDYKADNFSGVGFLMSLKNKFSNEKVAESISDSQYSINSYKRDIDTSEEIIKQQFPKEADLARLEQEVADLEQRMIEETAATDSQVSDDANVDSVNEFENDNAQEEESEDNVRFRKEDNILDYYIQKADTQKEYADKAKELGRKYNVPIRIITNRNQLPPRIKNRMKSNRVYPGVFDVRTGEIYVLVNEVQDLNEVELTITHEIVAHKGLRELLGNEAFDQLCDDVYYSMRNADINNIAELYNTNDRKVIADEYMAQLAETGKFPNWFDRVIASVRNMLREAGMKARYSDADIMYLLWESRRRLTKQGAAGYVDYKASESDVVANVKYSKPAFRQLENTTYESVTQDIYSRVDKDNFNEYLLDNNLTEDDIDDYWINEYLNEQYDFSVNSDGYVEFNTLTDESRQLIGNNKTKLYHHTSTAILDNIKKNGIVSTDSNVNRNGYPNEGVYLTTEYSGNAVDGYKYNVVQKLGGEPITLEVVTTVNELREDSNDSDIRSGQFQFVVNEVLPENILNLNDSNIRFRISPDNKPRMLTARGDKFREFMQDKMLSVRKLQELVQQRGGIVPQAAQVYEAENRASSRSKAQIEDYNNNEQSNLIDTLVKINKPIPEINLYLKAKSSIERNDNEGTMAISEDKDDQWNREYVTKLITDFETSITPELTQELWDNIKACTDFAIKKLYLGNVISKDAYNGMKKRKFYVPLKNWQTLNSENPEDYYDYITGADRTAYQGLKKAHGRSSEADDPLAYIEAAAHSAVATANKNMVKHKALMLVRLNHQMTDLFNLNRVYLMDKGEKDEEGNPIYYNVIKGENGSAMRIARFDAQGNPVLVSEGNFEQLLNDRIIFKKVTREHSARRPSYLARQHEVKVYENGDLYVIAFGDPRVANALNNYEMPWLETATRIVQNTFGVFNRWLTANFTAKNPAFIPVNWIKDTGYASISHSIKDDGELKAFTENYPKSVQAIHRYLSGKADIVNNEFDKLYQAFREFGGETGYVHLVDIKSLKKDIEREVNRRKGIKKGWDQVGQRKAIKAAGELLNYMAIMSENSSRFATFVAAVKAGRSYEQAATEAKNVTVNFNRKGRLSGLFGSFYGFFNATVQGGHNFAYMAKHHGKNMAIATGTFYLAAVMLAELMRSVGPEDEEGNKEYDKLPLWVRQNCLTIPTFWNDNFITIPLPPGFRSIWAMGITTSDMIHGKSTAGEATFDMISSITEMFSPFAVNDTELRQGKIPYRPIIPTTLVPIYDAATNQDFTGRKLYYVPYTKDLERYTPKTEWAPQNVNGAFKTAAELINKLGGGDDNRPAGFNKQGEYNGLRDIFFNLNPAIMEHTTEYYLGGRGKFFNELYKTVRDAADPKKEVQSYNIPIIKRLYTKPYAGNVWEDYREIGQQVKDFDYFLKNAQKTGDIDQITTMIDRQEMLVISAMYKQYSKAVQAYSDAIPYMNNPEEVKEMRKKRELLIKDFMQRVSEVKDTDNNKDDEPTIITTTK